MVKMFKKFIAGIVGATLFMMTSSCSLFEDVTPPPQCTIMVSAEENEENEIKSDVIYSNYNIPITNNAILYYNMYAFSNGKIVIEIYSNESTDPFLLHDWGIGYIEADFNAIAYFGEWGYSGISVFSTPKGQYMRYTQYYIGGEKIPYQIRFFIDHQEIGIIGCVHLYVKESYLNTTQTLNVFGTEVEIPFGTESLQNSDTKELESQINDLNTQIEQLKLENARLEQDYNNLIEENERLQEAANIQCGDTNGDGRISLSDPVILMRYNVGTVDELPYRGKKDNEGKDVPEG